MYYVNAFPHWPYQAKARCEQPNELIGFGASGLPAQVLLSHDYWLGVVEIYKRKPCSLKRFDR